MSTAESVVRVLVVIPVYNHGGSLREVVAGCLDGGWPVLVVDDGSNDGGPEQLDDLPCKVHHHSRNLGKGAAILTGARLASQWGYDAIVTVDADGQLDPREIGLLVDEARCRWPILVVGARRMDRDNAPRSSLFGRKFSNFWVRLECGRDLPDTQSGFRLYPVEPLSQLPVRTRRYDFEVEVLARAAWAGLRIGSVPVSVRYAEGERHNSHFHQLKDNLRLTLLHTTLVTRALFPWPHRRLAGTPPSISSAEMAGRRHPLRLLRHLVREHGSPLELAVAVWMGIFLGALPLIAVHTVVILYVTHRLHLNKIAAVAASQFCAPPILPVVCVEVGYFLRHGALLLDASWETLVVQAPYRLWEWALGSLIVGPLLGLVGGGLAYFARRWFRSRKAIRVEAAANK